MSSKPASSHAPWVIVAVFAVLYLTWSSTFLGIRYAVQSMPPMSVGVFRHLGAGLILLTVIWLSKRPAFDVTTVRNALLVGAITNGISNGCLIVAEVTVPSSLAVVAFTTMPLFMLVLNWFWFERVKPHPLDWLAFGCGIAGTCLAMSAGSEVRGVSLTLRELLILVACPFFWALGSLMGRKLKLPGNIWVSAGLQMAGGGLLLLFGAAITNEWSALHLAGVTKASWLGLLYLLIFGSLVGYSAFAFLIRRTDPRLVGTYAFVNPTIAFLLAGLAGERVLNFSLVAGAALAIGSAAILFAKPVLLKSLKKVTEAS